MQRLARDGTAGSDGSASHDGEVQGREMQILADECARVTPLGSVEVFRVRQRAFDQADALDERQGWCCQDGEERDDGFDAEAEVEGVRGVEDV